MSELPVGTVTFLFTDIEGSTRLLTALGDEFGRVVDRHHAILRGSISDAGGVVVGTEGDAFFAVFANAPAAVRAALDAQRALLDEPWPGGEQVRVRMGMLTGDGLRGGDNYVGLDVHRAARIAAAAHGGQVVIGDTTRGLVERSLPEGVALRDLGEHRLKDLARPERILQLVADGLPTTFPPLRSLDARPNNLPALVSSFVGRARETREVIERLAAARLLTLTGPGGTGKTRLALNVAADLLDEYEHGCWFVPLEVYTEPELILPAIAAALGVGLPGDRPAVDVLGEWLAERKLLLVLDNFEQVTDAAPIVSQLLGAAPGLRVLATSRTPLHIYGESEYPVPPLAVLGELRDAASTSAEALSQYEAVQLFIERAVAAKPAFSVTNANAPAVAEICVRLDGLPLAIELAAARVKLLTPEQILARLTQSLSLLSSSASDLPERQRTLNGAIDWSYRLLSPAEQRFFARLAVFSGGISLAAAEEVAGADAALDVFDGLASLVDKSLARGLETADEPRFTLLETIRQYAGEMLAADGAERESTLRRHAEHFFALAQTSERELTGANQIEWLDRLEREDDNLRAAFESAPEIDLLDEALLAAGGVWRYYQQRGRLAEARSIFDRLLAVPGADSAARAKALTGAGGIAYWQTDYDATARWYSEARELFEAAGDKAGLADALFNEAFVPMVNGDFESAIGLAERARHVWAEIGDELGVARAAGVMGMAAYLHGDYTAAIPSLEDAITILRAQGELFDLADVLTNLAMGRAMQGDWNACLAALRESLTIFAEAGNQLGLAMVLDFCGMIATMTGAPDRAAQLFGFAHAAKTRIGGSAPTALVSVEGFPPLAAKELGQVEYDRLFKAGRSLGQAEAIELGLRPVAPGTPPMPSLDRLGQELDAG